MSKKLGKEDEEQILVLIIDILKERISMDAKARRIKQLLTRPQKQVTREWVRAWEEKIEHICNQGEMPDLDTMLKELEIEVGE